ncbi:MAG: P-loop NTPase [Fibrobacter sp.]|nr:P-loop NTPase [Fibrobacter sp.]
MNIAVASGKGGTGKTTVSTNLSFLLSQLGEKVRYIDCDVEEPNGHLFLNPEFHKRELAFIPVPVIDELICDACGVCTEFCNYRALVRLGKTVMVFPELCHGCGGCKLLCPRQAITEKGKEIGAVEIGRSGSIDFVHGRLNIGEAMSPPLIRAVQDMATEDAINIIDAPPGTTCPVIASIGKADFILLVTEPTPFGLNDLEIALEMVRELKIPHGVVINRAEVSNRDAEEFCDAHNVKIMGKIQDDRAIAENYSRGKMILTSVPEIRENFSELWQAIKEQIHR